MIRAVLDANVFVSAVLSPVGIPAKILDAWRAEQFYLLVSKPILHEIDRVFHYPKIVKRHMWSAEKIRAFIEDLARLAIFSTGDLTLSVIAEDPSDNRYIECAVEGEAAYIVSGDRHLLSLAEYEGIRILTPKAFLDVVRRSKNEP